LSEEFCIADWEFRKDQRTTHPGAGAFDFDMLMNVIVDNIIGFDADDGGIFGKVAAYSQTVEEQGRKTLHSHFLLWIPELQSRIREMVACRNRNKRIHLITELRRYIDTVASTKLHNEINAVQIHDCGMLTKCSTQELRDMRHKTGCKVREGIVAKCVNCNKHFNSEQLAATILSESYNIDIQVNPESKQLDPKHILDCIAMRHIYDVANVLSPIEREKRLFLINAFFNLHRSVHAKSCFKKKDECRFDLPSKAVEQTIIEFSENPQKHFNWWGGLVPTNTFTVQVKRDMLNVFMNQYCPFVSEAIGCNSNIAIGNIRRLFYCTTYSSKGTQDEDKKAFENVSRVVLRRMQQHTNVVDEYSEGISRLFSAIVAHSKANIVSAPLARHLVIHGSRFHFSHEFAKLPIHAFARFAQGLEVGHFLRKHKNIFIPRSMVSDYAHRPTSLSQLNVWDFVSNYKVEGITKENEKDAIPFQRSHPGHGVLAVFKRTKSVIPELPFYFMPDLANVGDIASTASFNASQQYVRERYAMMALLLFCPFRTPEDLKMNDLFMPKYQWFVLSMTQHINTTVLDNIQRCHNALKENMVEDSLIKETVGFDIHTNQMMHDENCTEEEEFDSDIDLSAFDGFNENAGIINHDANISTTWMQHQGKNNCGLDAFETPKFKTNDTVFIDPSTCNADSRRPKAHQRDRVSTNALAELYQRQDKTRVTIENKHRKEDHWSSFHGMICQLQTAQKNR